MSSEGKEAIKSNGSQKPERNTSPLSTSSSAKNQQDRTPDTSDDDFREWKYSEISMAQLN